MKKIIVVVACLLATGCTTITATKGDFTLTRTAFGVNLELPKMAVTETISGENHAITMQLEGMKSDSAQAIEAAVTGVVAGMGKAAAP